MTTPADLNAVLPPALALDADPIPPDAIETFVDWAIERAHDTNDAAALVSSLAEVVSAGTEADSKNLPDEVQRFHVHDLGSAEWAMRKWAELDGQIETVRTQADVWISRIREWQTAELQRLVVEQAFFDQHLTAYMAAVREASKNDKGEPRTKSLKLPSGTLKSIGHAAVPLVEDEAALIAWARENVEPDEIDEVVRVRTDVMISGLRRFADVKPWHVCILQMGCGHEISYEADETPEVGSQVFCYACEGKTAEVLAVDSDEIVDAVLDNAGRPIDGAGVKPAHVTYSIKAAS